MSQAPPVRAKVRIIDEFKGVIDVTWEFSEDDARKVVEIAPSVARLYFGHNTGPQLQEALQKALLESLE